MTATTLSSRSGARTTARIISYELSDVMRSRWLIAYGAFFFVVTEALLRFSGSGAKAALSLVNIVLFLIPLVTIVFGTMYLYHAREFVELLLAQPVRRRQLFTGLYLGLAAPLSLAFLIGLVIPYIIHGVDATVQRGALAALALAGVALTFVFTAIAMLITVRTDDRVKGLGLAIGVWLLLAVLYDGLVLLGLLIFADYPLESPALTLMMSNPIDLARVTMLLRFDAAALMGYTGAVLQRFFGSIGGSLLAGGALVLWTAVPVALGRRAFQRKDF